MSSQNNMAKTSASRRHFLQGVLATGAGITAIALIPKGVAAVAEENIKLAEDQSKKGYHVTPHIIDYYQSAS